MPISQNELTETLKTKFQEDEIEIKDLVGDQNHYQITITSDEFVNLTKLKQHRLVMAVLKEKLKEELHAVQIITKTP